MSDHTVNPSWCPVHGIGAKQERRGIAMSWWECPKCNVAVTHAIAPPIVLAQYTATPPLKLQRTAYARALTDAQVCDQAEAEKRAARIYPEAP